MVTTGNDTPFSDGEDDGTSQNRRADDSAAVPRDPQESGQENGMDSVSNNAVLLDEIETLLHELSSEFPASGDAKRAAAALPQDAPAVAARPAIEAPSSGPEAARSAEVDLGKPIDYASNPSRYDFRRAGESYQADVAVRSMARKLAPSRDHTASEPAPGLPPDPVPAAPVLPALAEPLPAESSPGGAEADDHQDSEKWAQRRRRLRLRPARRVPGSRQEAQFNAHGGINQMSDADWDPRSARQRAGGRPGYGAALGAGITLLVIVGAGSTFALIKPLNKLLPEPIALVFGQMSDELSGNGDEDGKAVAGVSLTSGSVISEEALALRNVKQDRARRVATIPVGTGSGAAPQFDTATGRSATTEPVIVQTPKVAEVDAAPSVSATGLAESIRNEPVRVETAQREPVRSADRSGDKSAERINQDAVVQAILKDPKKRALAPPDDGQNADIAEAGTNNEPVTTGSITSPVADERIRGANAVARQASATSAEIAGRVQKRTLETKNTVKIAGLAHNAPFGVIQGADEEPGPQIKTVVLQPDQPKLTRTDKASLGNTGLGLPGTSIEGLLARGHELLQQGDIASARLLFRRVVAMGDSRGAKGMGMTYDPRVYQGLPVAGMSGDAEQAEIWYRKARELSEVKPAPDATATDTLSVSGN